MAKNARAVPGGIVTFGGWYQRTTLHLSEVYDLFAEGKSTLKLSHEKLKEHQRALRLESVRREAGYLEFVSARTKEGIAIRYYEDGLYILELETDDIAKGKTLLENYFMRAMNPAVSYIFSLGAPTPKILANIKTVHPTVISATSSRPETYAVGAEFGPVYQKIVSEDIAVYKTPLYIFVVSKPNLAPKAAEIVAMQIFFREFKDQLEKYLFIHRHLWEEIAAIKERRNVRGTEVEALRSRLDEYQKTINLINNRINQMGAYVRTRSAVAKKLDIETHLVELFQFKFEVLTDTLDYIKELWKMTVSYLMSAIQNLVEIKNQSATRGIQSLQLITSLGVVSGIIGYLSRSELPNITSSGAFYFALIIVATWLVNYTITRIYSAKKYALNVGAKTSDI